MPRKAVAVSGPGVAIAGYLAGDKNPQVDEVMPSLGEVADAFYRHAELLTEFFDEEGRACRDIRKHVAWYFKGYPVGGEFRADLARVESLQQAADLLGLLERDTPYQVKKLRVLGVGSAR